MEKEKVCNGECIKCSFGQQVYCAAQHGHAILENQKAIIRRLDIIAEAMPFDDEITPVTIAQEGSGADKDSQNN